MPKKKSVTSIVQMTPVIIIPRVLKIPDAARYLSATPWFVEELLRRGKVPSFIQGKDRVVDCRELDKYVERQNSGAPAKLTARTTNLNKARAA